MKDAAIKQIHHLNCCTNMPKGGRLINGESPAKVCCHCVLIETDKGLILIDTGIGLEDMKDPSRTGPLYRINRPRIDENETAIRQIEKLNLSPSDVRHIIMTHLDLDHTGGLPDFPYAKVHVHKKEFDAAMNQIIFNDKIRYRKVHWEHSPDWVIHDLNKSEPWFGFECIRNLEGLPKEIVLIQLPGHTKGHCGVAVKTDSKWLLYAGDTYFFYGEMDQEPSCSIGFKIFRFFGNHDNKMARATKKQVYNLIQEHRDELILFSAHDRREFEELSMTKIR